MSDAPNEQEGQQAPQTHEDPQVENAAAPADESPAQADDAPISVESDAATTPAPATEADAAPAAEEEEADQPESEEDAVLRARIAALEEELHDADVAHAEAVEESHLRANAEDRLRLAKEVRAEADAAAAEAAAVRDAAAERGAGRGQDAVQAPYEDIRAQEHLAASEASAFADVWSVTVDRQPLDGLVAAEPENGCEGAALVERLAAAKRALSDATDRATALKAADAAESNSTERTPGDATVDAATKELEVELRRIAKVSTTLRAAVNEQRFHLRRGSHLKQRTVSVPAKYEFLELDQERRQHDRVCEAINEEEFQKATAHRELESVKREARNQLRIAAEEKASLLANISELSKALEEIDWEYQTLAEENMELRELRRTMIRAQSAIRLNAKQ